jgi:hypothetical protein
MHGTIATPQLAQRAESSTLHYLTRGESVDLTVRSRLLQSQTSYANKSSVACGDGLGFRICGIIGLLAYYSECVIMSSQVLRCESNMKYPLAEKCHS